METTQMTPAEKKAEREKRRRKRQKIRRLKVGAGLCLALALVLYLLSAFVFFKIDTIEVCGVPDENGEATAGSSYYTAEEIIRASGAETGGSLVNISKSNAEKNIEKLLPYIGNAVVKRKYPSTLRIIVEDTNADFAVETGGFVLFDENYKVLETVAESPKSCTKLIGVSVDTAEPGSELRFTDEAYKVRIASVMKACEEAQVGTITKLDLTNIASVKIVIDSRITLILGTITDLPEKLATGLKTIEAEQEYNPNERIIIDVSEKDRSYVRDDYSPYEEEESSEEMTQAEPENDGGDSVDEPMDSGEPPEAVG